MLAAAPRCRSQGGRKDVAGPHRLAEDQQDVVGEPPARVLQEQPDQLPDGGVQVGLGQRLGDQLLAELEEPALTVAGLDQAVGIEQQPVAGPQRDVLTDRTGRRPSGGAERRWSGVRKAGTTVRSAGSLDNRLLTLVINGL